MLCEQTVIYFKTNTFVKESAAKLRGFIAEYYRNILEFHHHIGEKFDYRHPLIQYKIINGEPLVMGICKGSILLQLLENFDELKTGKSTYQVIEMQSKTIPVEVTISYKRVIYSFLTPWLALNEKNYEKYQRLGMWKQKKSLLEKILVGNILSMSKSLGYTVPAPIEANIIDLKEVPTKLKGTSMLGFLCTFSVNFEIPDYWGIGKSVSRGFGTVKRMGD